MVTKLFGYTKKILFDVLKKKESHVSLEWDEGECDRIYNNLFKYLLTI